jgi:copper ion binding protein
MSTTTTLLVDGMTCDHCVSSVQAAVGKVDGVTDVAVDLASGRVTVAADPAPDAAALRAAVEDAGFDVRP